MFYLFFLLLSLNEDQLIAYTPVIETDTIVVRHAPVKEWDNLEFKRESK